MIQFQPGMKIINWNLNSIKSKLPELQILIAQNNPEILLIQETRLKPHEIYQLKNFTTHRKDVENTTIACGGVLIAIKNNLFSEPINLQTDLQAVAVRMKHPINITICSIYLHQKDDITEECLDNLLKQLPTPFILSGDFNAHNATWGSNHTDIRGKNIEKVIDRKNLVLLNSGQSTHFNSFNGSFSSIDLGLCSSSLAHMTTWNPLPSLFGSDHYPILMDLQTSNNLSNKKFPSWRIKEADWSKFMSCVHLQPIDNTMDINSQNRYIVGEILTAASKSIPKNSIQITRKQTVWWNNECKKQIQTKNKLLTKFKRHPSEENLKNFKIARAKCKRTIREAKKQSWVEFTSTINVNTPVSEVWNQIRKISRTTYGNPITCIKTNAGLTAHQGEIAEKFSKHFFEMSSNDMYPPPFQTTKSAAELNVIDLSSSNEEEYNQPLTLDELLKAIKSMRSSAPGPDQIHIDMIKKLNTASLKIVLQLMENIWTTNILPDDWKLAHIIPILKPGKSVFELTSYRPISLTNTLCKVMEKIVNTRLKNFMEDNKLFDPMQYGFRAGRSTTDLLVKLHQQISDGFINGQFTVLISFDLEKAFDRIWRYKIIEILQQYNIKGNLAKFIEQFLNQRTFQVRLNDILSPVKTQENGTPQGSVITYFL